MTTQSNGASPPMMADDRLVYTAEVSVIFAPTPNLAGLTTVVR